jgi:hypothetical protein
MPGAFARAGAGSMRPGGAAAGAARSALRARASPFVSALRPDLARFTPMRLGKAPYQTHDESKASGPNRLTLKYEVTAFKCWFQNPFAPLQLGVAGAGSSTRGGITQLVLSEAPPSGPSSGQQQLQRAKRFSSDAGGPMTSASRAWQTQRARVEGEGGGEGGAPKAGAYICSVLSSTRALCMG